MLERENEQEKCYSDLLLHSPNALDSRVEARAEARSWEHHLGLPPVWKEASYLRHEHCLSVGTLAGS